jgi:hypothetical protein
LSCTLDNATGLCDGGACSASISTLSTSTFHDITSSTAAATTETVDLSNLVTAASIQPSSGSTFVQATISFVAADRSAYSFGLTEIAILFQSLKLSTQIRDPILSITYFPQASEELTRLTFQLRLLGGSLTSARAVADLTTLIKSASFVRELSQAFPASTQVLDSITFLELPVAIQSVAPSTSSLPLAAETSSNSLVSVILGVVAVCLLVLVVLLLVYRHTNATQVADLEASQVSSKHTMSSPLPSTASTPFQGTLKSSLIGIPSTVCHTTVSLVEYINHPRSRFTRRL